MELPAFFSFFQSTLTYAGEHALEELPGIFRTLGISRPLLLSDRGVEEAGLTELILSVLSARGKIVPGAQYFDIPEDSDTETAETLAAIFESNRCDSLLAVGGGSVIDTAKGVNILVSDQSKELSSYAGTDAVKGPFMPLIAVPTTSGSGSEAAPTAVIKDTKSGKKHTYCSPEFIPDAAVLDPRMTLTLPAYMSAASGMEALSQCVEAYIGLAKNPFSDTAAQQAIRLIIRYLPRVLETPYNRSARLQMSIAAHLAGRAFANSMGGLVDTIGHAAGALCRIPHGICRGILLPYSLRYNQHRAAERIGELLLPTAGEETYHRTLPADRPDKMIEQLSAFSKTINQLTGGALPLRFRDILTSGGTPVMSPHHLPVIADHAMEDPSQFYSPEAVSRDELIHVLLAAYWGYPLDTDLVKKGHQK